ncbi:MAG: hypothetical protein ACLR23_23015 [Clostridia bacterium]
MLTGRNDDPGVIALEKAGFRAAVMEAAKATLDRAQEMKQSIR